MKSVFRIILLFMMIPVSFISNAQEGSLGNAQFYILWEDAMPHFPGGEAEMKNFIKERQKYPKSALDMKIEGRVMARFIVKASGSIDSIRIIKGIHPDCDSLVVDIIKEMPKWTWEKNIKHKKNTWFTLPVIFRLPIEGIVEGEEIFAVADSMPSFPDGEKAMMDFLNKNLTYPKEYQEIAIQGRITIRFIVSKNGKILNPKIIRGIDPLLDKEALRVINLMPDWVPGKHKGENVHVYYTTPIIFKHRH